MGDLNELNDVGTTINYEDLNLDNAVQAFENNLQRRKAANQWLSRSSELLDLSSGDSRDTPGNNEFDNNQQSGSNNQGLIPQIVMNPWGSEAPMMTFAVQAYQHQWLLQVRTLSKLHYLGVVLSWVKGVVPPNSKVNNKYQGPEDVAPFYLLIFENPNGF